MFIKFCKNVVVLKLSSFQKSQKLFDLPPKYNYYVEWLFYARDIAVLEYYAGQATSLTPQLLNNKTRKEVFS